MKQTRFAPLLTLAVAITALAAPALAQTGGNLPLVSVNSAAWTQPAEEFRIVVPANAPAMSLDIYSPGLNVSDYANGRALAGYFGDELYGKNIPFETTVTLSGPGGTILQKKYNFSQDHSWERLWATALAAGTYKLSISSVGNGKNAFGLRVNAPYQLQSSSFTVNARGGPNDNLLAARFVVGRDRLGKRLDILNYDGDGVGEMAIELVTPDGRRSPLITSDNGKSLTASLPITEALLGEWALYVRVLATTKQYSNSVLFRISSSGEPIFADVPIFFSNSPVRGGVIVEVVDPAGRPIPGAGYSLVGDGASPNLPAGYGPVSAAVLEGQGRIISSTQVQLQPGSAKVRFVAKPLEGALQVETVLVVGSQRFALTGIPATVQITGQNQAQPSPFIRTLAPGDYLVQPTQLPDSTVEAKTGTVVANETRKVVLEYRPVARLKFDVLPSIVESCGPSIVNASAETDFPYPFPVTLTIKLPAGITSREALERTFDVVADKPALLRATVQACNSGSPSGLLTPFALTATEPITVRPTVQVEVFDPNLRPIPGASFRLTGDSERVASPVLPRGYAPVSATVLEGSGNVVSNTEARITVGPARVRFIARPIQGSLMVETVAIVGSSRIVLEGVPATVAGQSPRTPFTLALAPGTYPVQPSQLPGSSVTSSAGTVVDGQVAKVVLEYRPTATLKLVVEPELVDGCGPVTITATAETVFPYAFPVDIALRLPDGITSTETTKRTLPVQAGQPAVLQISAQACRGGTPEATLTPFALMAQDPVRVRPQVEVEVLDPSLRPIAGASFTLTGETERTANPVLPRGYLPVSASVLQGQGNVISNTEARVTSGPAKVRFIARLVQGGLSVETVAIVGDQRLVLTGIPATVAGQSPRTPFNLPLAPNRYDVTPTPLPDSTVEPGVGVVTDGQIAKVVLEYRPTVTLRLLVEPELVDACGPVTITATAETAFPYSIPADLSLKLPNDWSSTEATRRTVTVQAGQPAVLRLRAQACQSGSPQATLDPFNQSAQAPVRVRPAVVVEVLDPELKAIAGASFTLVGDTERTANPLLPANYAPVSASVLDGVGRVVSNTEARITVGPAKVRFIARPIQGSLTVETVAIIGDQRVPLVGIPVLVAGQNLKTPATLRLAPGSYLAQPTPLPDSQSSSGEASVQDGQDSKIVLEYRVNPVLTLLVVPDVVETCGQTSLEAVAETGFPYAIPGRVKLTLPKGITSRDTLERSGSLSAGNSLGLKVVASVCQAGSVSAELTPGGLMAEGVLKLRAPVSLSLNRVSQAALGIKLAKSFEAVQAGYAITISLTVDRQLDNVRLLDPLPAGGSNPAVRGAALIVSDNRVSVPLRNDGPTLLLGRLAPGSYTLSYTLFTDLASDQVVTKPVLDWEEVR
jgi:hypothetical protein